MDTMEEQLWTLQNALISSLNYDKMKIQKDECIKYKKD